MDNLDNDGWQKISDFPVEKDEEYVLIDELKSRFEMYNIENDGNCLFRAISYAYYGTENEYEYIKTSLSEYIKSNQGHTDVKNIVIGSMDIDKKEHLLPYAIQNIKYLEKLNTPRYWGNQQECIIIAKIMNINIEVYDMTGNKHEYLSETKSPVKTIYLYYCGKIPSLIKKRIFTHFNVLELKPQPPLLSRPLPLSPPSELEQKIFELKQRREKILQELRGSNYVKPTYESVGDFLRLVPTDIPDAKKLELNNLINTYDFDVEPDASRIINDPKYKKIILNCILNTLYSVIVYPKLYSNEEHDGILWELYKKELDGQGKLVILSKEINNYVRNNLLKFNRQKNLEVYMKTVPDEIKNAILPHVENGYFDDTLTTQKTFSDIVIPYLHRRIDNTVDSIALLTQQEEKQLKRAAKKLIIVDRKLKTNNIIALEKEIIKFIMMEYTHKFIQAIYKYINQSALIPKQQNNVKDNIIKIYQANHIIDSVPAFEERVMKPVVTEYMKKYIDNLVDGIVVLPTPNDKELLKTSTQKALEINDKKLKTYNIPALEKIAIEHVGNETIPYFAGGKNKTAKQDYFKLVSMYK